MRHDMQLKTNNTTSTWIGLTRIILGFLLIWKGLLFTQDTSELQLAVAGHSGFLYVVAAVVSILTLISGIFITVGFFTKVISFVQIAMIIIGIAFIIYTGAERNSFDMISTFIILGLLAFYFHKGSGSISFDKAILKNQNHE